MISGESDMLDIVYNPSAGGHHGEKIKKCMALVEARLKERQVEYRLHQATVKGQTSNLTKTLIDEGATDLIIVGVDGTLHAAINSFHSFERCNMGIIPCGTGNDFATALNLPLDPVKAIDLIIDGTPKYTDFMQLPGIRGLNVAGMGIDAEVLNYYEKLKKKTKFGYTKCLMKALAKFKYTDLDVEINGQTTNYHSFIAVVANSPIFGGGIPICPPADPTDCKLDFLTVKSMRKLAIIFAFLKLKKGKVMKFKQTEHKPFTEIKIKSSNTTTVNVDGELYENIPFEVTIVSNTLKIYR